MASNHEQFRCVWLDKFVNTSKEHTSTCEELREIMNNLQKFENNDKCEKYIRGITDEKVILIVSGSYGREIVPRLHDLPQFSACYVFCRDTKANREWVTKFPKIKGVFNLHVALLKQVTQDHINRVEAEEGTLISVLSSGAQSFQVRNAMFMWLQLFIEVLLRMHHRSDDRKELIDICKESHVGKEKQLRIIHEFETDYTPDKAVWWYTRDSCLYKMMNAALRARDFDMLFAFRFLITDIAKQIKQEYEDFIRTSGDRRVIQVYRGQLISTEELELMKNNVGEYLSMNSFLSTSRDRQMAVKFARKSQKADNMQVILFEIKIDPELRTKAFADVSQMSYYTKEGEVLIMLGALFKIDKIFQDETEEIWIACVSLASDDDFYLKEIFSHMKDKIGADTNLDTLGKLLLRMGENEKARNCYTRMLKETQLDVANAQLGLGWASLRCNACNEALEHFKESLKTRQRILGEDHASVGESYGFLGEAFRRKNQFNDALGYLTKAMIIQENTLPEDSLDLAATYDTIATTYTSIGKYQLALKYYAKVLQIREAKLPADHPQLAAIHSNIGWMHECEKNYKKALDCCEKALEINRNILPPTHHHVIEAENNIRRLKLKMKH